MNVSSLHSIRASFGDELMTRCDMTPVSQLKSASILSARVPETCDDCRTSCQAGGSCCTRASTNCLSDEQQSAFSVASDVPFPGPVCLEITPAEEQRVELPAIGQPQRTSVVPAASSDSLPLESLEEGYTSAVQVPRSDDLLH